MATFNKYVRLDPNILLEWVYDDTNLKQENYNVINNLTLNKKGFISTTPGNFNQYDNTIFVVDNLLKKYAKIDTNKFNFLKNQTFSTAPIVYDKVRLHMPTNFTFNRDNIVGASSYKGFYLHIYTYDTTESKMVDIASIIYDDEDPKYSKYINLNIQTLTYDNKFWGKYIEFSIPSINTVSNQMTPASTPLSNTINYNLTNGVGLSTISPVFIQFGFVSATETIFGTKYYYMSDIYSVSLSQTPEYQTLGVTVQESTNGDYFEIYGTYNNTNENLDDFMSELIRSGKSPELEYVVYLYEENILTSKQTFLVTDNFSQKLLYRPIIQFSNTTAAIDVEMNIIDLVDDSKITRVASIGLMNSIFKYGRQLSRIDISGAYKPKIYNRKQQSINANDLNVPANPGLTINKVNYPILVDRVKILAGSSMSNNTDYKKMGLLEIILTPFTNVIKFMIASDINSEGVATPYNLSKLLENSTITLSFKSDTEFLEKNIFNETDQNDYTNGIIVYKIEEADLRIIKSIGKSNTDFYLTVKSNNNDTRSLLYSGKFVSFNDIKFVDVNSNISPSIQSTSSGSTNNMTSNDTIIDTPITNVATNSIVNKNSLILLNIDANVNTFETYLSNQNAVIYLKEAGGNNSNGAFIYLLLNMSPTFIEDIKVQPGVKKVIPLDFELGKNLPTIPKNMTNINNQTVQFDANVAIKTDAQYQQIQVKDQTIQVNTSGTIGGTVTVNTKGNRPGSIPSGRG